jgi:hypothetical protein
MAAEEKRVVREKVSPEVWRERIERWKIGGLTGKEFAEKEGLSARSLSWWSWRLHRRAGATTAEAKRRGRPRGKRGPASRVSFLPVVVRATRSTEAPTAMEVVLSSGVRVRIWPGFDESTLLRIARTLGDV